MHAWQHSLLNFDDLVVHTKFSDYSRHVQFLGDSTIYYSPIGTGIDDEIPPLRVAQRSLNNDQIVAIVLEGKLTDVPGSPRAWVRC